MSAAKRTAGARRLVLNSVMYTPQVMPMGTAMSAARPMRMPVPTMALAIPPPVSLTGFGISVKKAQLRAGRPCRRTKKRMKASGTRATTTESAHRKVMAAEVSLRTR